MTAALTAVVARPRQAIILADIHGDRPRSAESGPLPMLEFHGRPFLAYLVELLREQGFTEALMMARDDSTAERAHFSDGSAFGLRITYSVAASLHQLQAIGTMVQEHFLLLRAEHYWPMLFDRMWSAYLAAGVPALATVYANKDGYAPDVVRVDPDGMVSVYDRSGQAAGLKGAEIGYSILHRDVLDLLPHGATSIEEALYPLLVQRRRLAAHATEHRFYGVGSSDRLTLTDLFLARKPAVILARDGVLNRHPPAGRFIRSVAEFEWLPGALDALRAFRQAGYTVIVVSHDDGLARGQVSIAALEEIHAAMRVQSAATGGGIDAIYHCPRGWSAGCGDREPNPGLLFQAQHDFSLDLTRTPLLGDDESDMACAAAAGAPGRLVTAEEPLIVHARRIIGQERRS